MADPLRKPDPEPQREPNIIGKPFRRVDGRAKVTGATRFADDLAFPPHVLRPAGALGPCRTRTSCRSIFRRPRRFRDISALSPARKSRFPSASSPSRRTSTRSARNASALLAIPSRPSRAVTEDAAYEAALRVKIEYEPLLTISSIEDALANPEPRIHDYGDQGNLHKVVSMTFGEVEKGFEEADQIFEDVFYYEGNTHLPMEQHCAIAVAEDADRVTLHLLHADAALRAPRAHQSAGAAGGAHPRRGLLQRRRLRRQERSVQSRDRRREAGFEARPAGEDHAHPRGGLLLPPRTPPPCSWR